MPTPSIAQRFLNPRLLAQPFVDTQQVTPGQQRLHWNENCFDFPTDLKEMVLQQLAAAKWSDYPNKMRPFDLIERLAMTYNVNREMVAVSIGSSDLLRIILGAVLQPGDQMVTVTPTFYAYKLWGELLGATVHTAQLIPQNNFALPVDELLVLTRLNNAKLIVLCTPNNPTGAIYPRMDLRRLAAESNALLLIDEAYAEFCGQDLQPLLHDFENVILLRTFSKAYALAGVRIGYALAAPAIGVELQKATTVFTLNCFAEIVANVALDHRERFLEMAQEIVAERERLAQALGALSGVHVFPSGANFLLARLDRLALPLCQQILAECQIVVAPMHNFPGMENYLRISVGLPAVNQLLTTTLARLLK